LVAVGRKRNGREGHLIFHVLHGEAATDSHRRQIVDRCRLNPIRTRKNTGIFRWFSRPGRDPHRHEDWRARRERKRPRGNRVILRVSGQAGDPEEAADEAYDARQTCHKRSTTKA
jgi:hypothetical protein